MMRAIVYDEPGGPEVLKIGETVSPPLGPDDIRIRVRSSAVNRADILQRKGLYPPPPGASTILGLEASGDVLEVGANVTGWRQGDRVMALLAGGGYAEEAVVNAGSAMAIPDALSYDEAGAFPEVFLTAFLNIFCLGTPPPGGKVLVHGGGSGVGTAAILLCREAGLKIFVTAGSEEKRAKCLALGADVAINYRTSDFAAIVLEATGNAGVNVVLDPIGARYLEKNLACLAREGRLVVIGSMGGERRAELDFAALLRRHLHLLGSTLRTRPPAEKSRLVREFLARFSEALGAGRLRPVLDQVFPLEQAADAHRLVESSNHFGKVGLRVG